MTTYESRMERHKKNGLQEHRLLGKIAALAVGIGLVMWLILPYVYGDSGEQVAAAKKDVAALFYDNSEVFLNAKITQQQVADAQQQVNQLHGMAKGKLEQRVASAQRKLKAIEELGKVYDSEQPMIVGNVVSESQVLQPDITKETIQQALTHYQSQADAFDTTVTNLYTQANEILDNIDKANQIVDALPTTIAEGESLSDIAQQIKAADAAIESVKNQPQFKAGLEKYEARAKALSEAIIGESAEKPMSEDVTNQLFESDTMAQYLAGTALDNRPLIALTFDDGPNETYTPQVLDILAKYNVKATFFVMGAYVDDHPEMAKRIVDEGHQIGNHTYTHPDLATLPDDKVIQEIQWTQESIRDITGVTPDLYRLPFGSGGERVVKLLKPMTSIIWNVDSEDWKSHDKQAILDRVLSTLQPQSILLMHDTHQATPDALDALIPILQEKGYQFVMPEDIPFDYHYY